MYILKVGSNSYVKSYKGGELVISSKEEEAAVWETEAFARSLASKLNKELGTRDIHLEEKIIPQFLGNL